MNKPVVFIDISSDEEEKILHAKVRKENTPMKDENKKTKNKNNNGSEEEDDDCVILDYDPFESIDVSSKLSIKENEKYVDDDDVCIVAEKGQVAIRDYPHSRHLCVKLPFDTTPHHDYCGQCYCYVCDAAAPCKFWLNTLGGHCHATENCANWVSMREAARPAPAHDKTTLPSSLP